MQELLEKLINNEVVTKEDVDRAIQEEEFGDPWSVDE